MRQRRTLGRLLALAIALLALVMTIGACGSSDDSGATADNVRTTDTGQLAEMTKATVTLETRLPRASSTKMSQPHGRQAQRQRQSHKATKHTESKQQSRQRQSKKADRSRCSQGSDYLLDGGGHQQL